MNKVNTTLYIVFHILIIYYKFTCCIENSANLDQLASSKPSDLDLHYLQKSWYLVLYCFWQS